MSYGSSGRLVLAGDIGGTKTNLGLYEIGCERPEPVAQKSYASSESVDLESLVERFMEEHSSPVSAACFGVAGPVLAGTCRATNLPWIVSEESVRKRFGWDKVRLINDLVATAYSIPLLRTGELAEINRGERDPEGNIGLLAPGTGLGISFLVRRESKLFPVSSEGGHVDFAPRTDKEIALFRHLRTRLGRVSIERVISGPGLYEIYTWLRQTSLVPEPAWLQERMNREDSSKIVSEVGLAGDDPVCEEALDMFVSLLAAAAGNLALTVLATGGIYLGGGIPPKILPKLEHGPFMKAFAAKGRFEDLLKTVPVNVILNDEAALVGAARCALDL
mgnify:CR=1 FL=1